MAADPAAPRRGVTPPGERAPLAFESARLLGAVECWLQAHEARGAPADLLLGPGHLRVRILDILVRILVEELGAADLRLLRRKSSPVSDFAAPRIGSDPGVVAVLIFRFTH